MSIVSQSVQKVNPLSEAVMELAEEIIAPRSGACFRKFVYVRLLKLAEYIESTGATTIEDFEDRDATLSRGGEQLRLMESYYRGYRDGEKSLPYNPRHGTDL